MSKEIHFYCVGDYFVLNHIMAFTYVSFQECLHKEIEQFDTTQLSCLSTDLITKYGYHIFIHPYKGEVFEITLGDCANTTKEIRPAHNLEKMLIAGAFDTETTQCVFRER